MLIHPIVVSPFQMNCYVLACEQTKEAIIIDSGDEANRILSVIDDKGYALQYLINTHAHVDHVSAVAAIQKARNIPFYLHKNEEMVLGGLMMSQQGYGIGDGLMPTVTEYIDPAKSYTFGNQSLTVLETPGHTPGGVCFLSGNDIFVGDTLFAGSIGRTDLPGGNMPTLMSSIKNKLMSLEDHITVHSGHGPNTTIGQERATNPFLNPLNQW